MQQGHHVRSLLHQKNSVNGFSVFRQAAWTLWCGAPRCKYLEGATQQAAASGNLSRGWLHVRVGCSNHKGSSLDTTRLQMLKGRQPARPYYSRLPSIWYRFVIQPAVQHLFVDESSEGQRVDNFLLKVLKGVPKTHVYRLIRSGEVRVNKRRVQADGRLQLGDDVRIPPVRVAQSDNEQRQVHVPALEFPVLFEDDAMLAINKPAGVAVHGGSGVSFGVIEQLRQARPQARMLELVHRLDKETSGILLVAKKRSALKHLQDQFRSRQIDKRYLALVQGEWPLKNKVIDLHLLKYLLPNGERRVQVVSATHDAAQRSLSLIKVLAQGALPNQSGSASLLEVTIKTGRTHQIRVHLSHFKHPIAGDDKYGDFSWNKQLVAGGLRRMYLHAYRLQLVHPASDKSLVISAPIPTELVAWSLDHVRNT